MDDNNNSSNDTLYTHWIQFNLTMKKKCISQNVSGFTPSLNYNDNNNIIL